MDGPKCKLCGERHWGMCPDLPASTAIKLLMEPGSQPCISRDAGTPKSEATPPNLSPEEPSARATSKPRFDRTAYQREYMRKRRKEAKEQGKC